MAGDRSKRERTTRTEAEIEAAGGTPSVSSALIDLVRLVARQAAHEHLKTIESLKEPGDDQVN